MFSVEQAFAHVGAPNHVLGYIPMVLSTDSPGAIPFGIGFPLGGSLEVLHALHDFCQCMELAYIFLLVFLELFKFK